MKLFPEFLRFYRSDKVVSAAKSRSQAGPRALRDRFLGLGLLLLLLGSLSPTLATTNWDAGGDGVSWDDADNWTDGVPSTAQQTRFLNGGPDAAIAVTLSATSAAAKDMNWATDDNRTVTLNSGTLSLLGSGTETTIIWNTSAGSTAVTINSDVNYANSVDGTNTTFRVGLGDRHVTFNGDISTSGAGTRTMQLLHDGIMEINGSNAATFLSFGGTGELIAGSTSALGAGSVQKTSTATLSLRSDVTVNGASYSWLQNSVTSGIRISELAASSADRTLTLNSRMIGTGSLQFLSNVNSTGNLILELKSNSANAHTLDVVTNSTGIVRFAQTGNTSYQGVISGDGQVQKTVGSGTITFTDANTYTGKTTISTGTLLLSGAGSISATSEINVASGATFSVASIAGSSYTLESGQILSGEGSVVTGGKDLLLNGTLAPGSSPGTLTVDTGAGTFSLGADTDLQFELGTASDLVDLSSGTLNIGTGTLGFDDFSFTDGAGFGVGEYILFQTTESILGSFAGNTTGTVGGFNGELMFSGNNLILDVTVVPEPGTLSLLLLGGLSALLVRRKRA